MSKSDGLKIGIRFTEDLVGDVTDNKDAFAVTGKEYKYVNGTLLDREYQVDKVERYGVPIIWSNVEEYNLIEGDVDTLYEKYDTAATDTYLPNGTKGNVVKFKSSTLLLGISLKTIASGMHTVNIKTAYNGTTLATGSSNGTVRGEWIDVILNNSINIDIHTKDSYYIEIIHPSGISFVTNNPRYNGSVWSSEGAYFGTWYGSNYTFAMGVICEVESQEILESKIIELESILLTGQYRIRWLEDKPEYTDIIIEYATGEVRGQWGEVTSGEVVNIDTNLWIRATLSTEYTDVTPTLKKVWLEESTAPQDKILITMDWWNRFNNAEDKIKVLYDANKGSLTGAGGAVESFETSFTPEDLVQTPNPNEEELIKAYPYEIVLDLNELTFINAYSQEYVKAYPYEIVLELKHVSEINP